MKKRYLVGGPMMKRFLFVVPAAALAAIVACSSTNTIVEQLPAPDAGPTTSPPTTGDDDDDMIGPTTNDSGAPNPTQCTSARKTLLGPVSSVSTGAVSVVDTTAGVSRIYVDATAGGINGGATHPRTYLKLDGTKSAITDDASFTSSDWDLAFKRTDIYTNGGDSGPGKGAGLLVHKVFADVTAADADGIAQESFFGADCAPKTDDAGFVSTTFSGWYIYDETTHIPSPDQTITFVVKSAAGVLYKVGLLEYDANPDGSEGTSYGAYLFQVAKL